MKCELCSFQCEKLKSLTNHKRWHKLPKYLSFQNRYRIKVKIFNLGENNGMWAGNQVKYPALHDWVKYHKTKSTTCEFCGVSTDKLDLANISGTYKRDLSDFEWLCRRCHMIKDGRLERLKNRRCHNAMSKLLATTTEI